MAIMEILTSASRAHTDLAQIPGLEPQGGDTKHIWDSGNQAEVEAARTIFDKLVGSSGKGYSAFRVNDDGEPGTRLRSFDPAAEAMVLTPPLVGG